MASKLLPNNLNTFSTLRLDNFIYVDKTGYIYDLLKTGNRYFFLTRPRRFGKSLLLSTLEELFEGNKKLFDGLAIANTQYEWKYHPVIHIDFSISSHNSPEELFRSLGNTLDTLARKYSIDTTKEPSPQEKMRFLVNSLADKHGRNSVVILIDEYDKPMIDHIGNIELALQQQLVLKDFYGAFKGLDKYLRCIFITGVSKCAKTSIFSGMNNLEDISEIPLASTILGYTEEEIETSFADYIEQFSKEKNISTKDIINEMRGWYNGYSFSSLLKKVYNPHSVLKYLSYFRRENYWFTSATPSFLIPLLKKAEERDELRMLENVEVSWSTLTNTYDLDTYPVEVALYQTGYLTIKYETSTKFVPCDN